MPVIWREKGYRFEFFASDSDEPPHIHVKKNGRHAKFWLDPMTLAFNRRFRKHEMTEIRKIVEKHREAFLEAWHAFFRRGT